jgi:DNA-binding MarR family transcriptional regulator
VHHRLTERGRTARRAGDKILDRVLAESFAALSPKQLTQLGGLLADVLGSDAPA